MAKYSNTVEYNIRTTLDSSGITKLQAELSQLQNHLHRWNSRGLIDQSAFSKTIADIKTVQNALQQAFNPKLGMLNTSAFMKNLQTQGLTIKGLYESFSNAGAKGVQAFTSMYGQISKLDTGMRSVSSTTDKIMNTLGNTVRWGLIASGFSQVMNAAHQASQYVKDLDKSLTNIMMVSGETRDNMNAFAKSANEIAQRLGGTTTQMTEATKVFIQQGLSLEQSSRLAEYSVHLANVSEQDSATASDEITAYKNAFKIDLDDLGNAISKWAAVANNAAVSVEELSVASQKAASVATTVGVDMDQFAGHIAAIEATTREAPENIGNGLKTLYSRISDIKLGETLEDGVNLGQFTGALKKVGVEALDSAGELRDAGAIIEDIMAHWQEMSKTQQVATATTVAGRFQLARFMALMNSQDIYQNAVNVSRNETGTETYDRMQETYRDSLEGRLNALTAKVEEVFLNLFNSDSFNGAVDALTGLVDTLNELIEATGGGETAVLGLSTALFGIAKQSMSRGITNFIQNREASIIGQKNLAAQQQEAKNTLMAGGLNTDNSRLNNLSRNVAGMNQYATELNGEQRERVNSLISQAIELENGLTAAKKAEADATVQLQAVIAAEGGEISEVGEKLIQEIELLGRSGQQINVNSENYQKFMNLINSTANAISQFNEKLKQNSSQFSKNEIMTYANYLKQLAQQEGVAAEKADVLMKAYNRLKNLSKVGADVQQVTKAIGQASVVMAEMSDALGTVPSKVQQVTNNYLNAKAAVTEFGAACQSTQLQMQGLQEAFQMQHVINNVSNMVMGIGQLAFAIQSIKNLGSIWNNEDLSFGEKMLETVMNLGMTLPMAVMGIQQLGDGYKQVKAAIDAYRASKVLEAAATTAAAAATEAATAAKGGEAGATAAVELVMEKLNIEEGKDIAISAYLAAEKAALAEGLSAEAAAAAGAEAAVAALSGVELGATASTGLLTRALDVLKAHPVIAVITAALAIGAIAWGNYQQAIEDAKKAEMENLDSAISSADEMSKSMSSWADISEEWRETGVVSETAKEKAKDLADELEIAGGKALAAAGDFDTLNKKILDLGDSASQKSIDEAWRLLQGEYGKSLSGEELFNGSAHGDYINALNKGAGQVFSEGEGPYDTSTVAGVMRKHATSGKSVAEDIMQAKAAIQELNEAEEELKKNQDNLSTEAFKRQSEDIRVARQALQEFLSLEDVQAAQKAFETLFNSGTQLSSFQEKLSEAGGDVQEMMKIFENDANTGEYFSAITDRAERLKLMLSATNDEAQKLSIELTQTADNAATNMMQNQLDAGASMGRAQSVTQGIFDQVSDLNLYQEDAITLLAQISEEDSIQAINEGLARVKESGNIEDFKVPIELDPEQAKEAVKNAIDSITEEQIDSDVDLEEDKALAKSFAEDAGSYEGYSEELEGEAQAAQEAAEELLRYDAALESVQKNSEKWEQQLNSGSVQDQVKAAEELKNVYNDLLDVGEDLSVSNDFAKDADNLKLLEDAANGVEGAYEELERAAAKDILIHLGVDESEIPALLENISSIQDLIGDLEIGAVIQDEGVYQQLEKLVNDAGLTAEEASAFLSSIGVDIDPSAFEEGVQQVPEVAAEAAAQAADAMGIDTEIESGTAEEETTDTYSDVVANVTEVPFTSTYPAGKEGEETKTLQGNAKQVTYNVQTHSIPKHQATAGFSVKAKTKDGGGGSGNLTIKRGAARRGGSGGTKFANASHGGGSQGGSGGSCFVAGTLITTHNGYKNIEDIKKYDIVLSYNEKLNKNEYSLVIDTMIHNISEKIYNLYIENEKISVTNIHRFFIKRNECPEWICASELQINDLVWFADNTWHKINNIISEIQKTTVYNFEVSGNHNYYVGQNQILAHNKGGGGGSGKSNEPKSVKRTDKADSEFDIYNKVNANLSKNEDLLTRIDKQKSRMSGSRYRDALSKENKALKDQNKILQERNKIANAKAEALRTGKDNAKYGIYLKGESLATYGLTDNDNNGTVDNYKNIYNQAYAKQLAAQKAADDYFKSKGGAFDAQGNTTKEASMTEDEQKTYTELAEKAKEAAEYANKIKSVVDDYQSTMDQIRDDTEKIQENTEKIEDNVITIWKYARDAGKELSKMKQTGVDVRKTLATMWGDDPVKSLGFSQEKFTKMFTPDTEGMAKSLKELKKLYNNTEDEEQKKWLNQQIKLLEKAQANGDSRLDLNLQKMNELNKAYDQWLKTGKSDLFGTNEKEMFDAMQEAFEEGASYADDMASAIEEIKQDIQDIMDEMYEGIDDRITQFDQIIEQYEYVRDMTELIYGDKAYEMQSKMYTSEAQAGEERLHTLEAARAENHAMLQSLQEGSEEYKKALEKERELDKEILSTRQNIVQAYKDAKEAANNLAVENWLSNFTTSMNYIDPDTKEIATAMGIPIKYAADQWERVKENADLYLDELNKAWEIEKLQNKYQKMLNEATDPKIQQQITQQMQQQLEYLRNKTKLSKYDVDYANAQLEILQKTMALEDARDAKNKMKLRRDSQGNYEYVYTADQNDIADKENELLDAQMNGYNISVEASRQATDNFFNQIQNMADKLREVANDSTLTAEQIEAITQDIIAQGYEFLNANAEQLTTAQINAVNSFIAAAQNLAAENAVQVNSISEQLLANTTDNADLMTSVLHSAVQEWIGPDGLALFRDQADQTCEDIFDNVREFEKVISNANTNVKVPLNDMTTTINGANTALTALAGTADKFYEFLRDRSGIVKTAAGDLADYQAALTDTNNKMSAYYDAWKKNEESLRTAQRTNSQLEADLKSAQEDLAAERRKQEEEKKKREEEEKKKKESSSNNNGGYSDEEIAWGIAKNIWTYGSWGNDPQRRQRITNRYGSSVASRVQQIINQYCWSGALVDYSSSKWGYATGGYTGSWNEVTDFDQNGKLAVLHQKELVLNANDTENMLAAVEVVRNIINMLKGANSPMNLSTLGLQNASANNVEQRVEITAEFPNVQSSNEIERALLNLADNAYMYAHNKNETFI